MLRFLLLLYFPTNAIVGRQEDFTAIFLPIGASSGFQSSFKIQCNGIYSHLQIKRGTTTNQINTLFNRGLIDITTFVNTQEGSNLYDDTALQISLQNLITIHAGDSATCIGIVNGTQGNDAFYIFENSKLETEYVAMTMCDVVGVCQIAISAPDVSDITVTLPKRRQYTNPPCYVKYKSSFYREGDSIREILQNGETFQIQANCDLTGTFIKSTTPVAVFSGSHSVIVGWGDTYDFMMSQLLPTKYWGTEYIVYPYPGSKSGDIICIVAYNDSKTQVKIVGYGSYILQYKGHFLRRRIDGDRAVKIWASKKIGVVQYIFDLASKNSAMLISPPTNQYLDNINVLRHQFEMETFLIFKPESKGISDMINVSKSEYVAGQLQNSTIVSMNQFWAYGVIHQENHTTLMVAALGYGFNEQGLSSKPSVPGDRIDNDQNGEIDDNTQCAIRDWENKDCSKLNDGDESMHYGEMFIIPIIDDVGGITLKGYIEEKIRKEPCSRPSTVIPVNPVINHHITELSLFSDKTAIIFTGSSSKSMSAFTTFPVESLGLEYFALTYCPTGMSCNHSCSIVAAYDGTELFVRGHGSRSLNKSQSIMFSENNDISGTYIKANNPIAVTCGIHLITTVTHVSQFQLPPDDTWGRTYRIIFQESDSGTIRLMTSDGNTVVTLMEYEYEETGTIDTSGIVLIKTYTYRTVYAIVDPGDYKDINIENNTVYHLKANKPILVVYISSTPPYPFIIIGSSYAEYQTEKGTDNVTCQTTQIPFAILDGEKYFIPYRTVDTDQIASWWLRVNETVSPHNVSEQTPGDQIDNDGDGLVDEDFCGFLVTRLDGKSFLFDIDLDGALNEDCKGCQMGEEINEYLQCSACEIGTYRNAVGIDKCIACPTNYTTFLDNADSPSLCVGVCFEGYEYDVITNSCKKCAIGYFKDRKSSDWKNYNLTERWNCTKCPDSKTTLETGTKNAANCTDHCMVGYEKVPFTSDGSCEKCQYGWYKEHSSNSSHSEEDRWKCKPCPNNTTTVERGAENTNSCIDACPEGYELNNDTNKCQACAIGFYKDVNSSNTTVDLGRRWWCRECPTGQTTFFDATESQNDCLDNCGAGQQLYVNMDTPSQTCEACDYGWYKPHSSSDVNITAEERWNCTQCPDGTTTVIKGSPTVDLCLPLCLKGYQFNSTTQRCDECPKGFYKNISGNLENCTLCPNNLTTTKEGSYRLSHCHKEKCKCPCNLVGNPAKANLSVEQKAEILENHVKELKVDKKKLSSSIRKKISAPDNRPSSTAFGGLGILMISLAVAILVFFDATTLKNHFIMFYHNVKAIMGRE